MHAFVVAAKVALVVATLLCLSSIGGAMLVAFPILVPLHWLAASESGPYATGAWALLAALSMLEGAWMLTYVFTGNGWVGLAVGVGSACATATLFLRRGADRAAANAR